METQVQQPQNNGTPKWLWWVLGGGCVLLMCVAVVVIVALTILSPTVGKTFSSISTEIGSTPQVNMPDLGQYPSAKGNTLGDPNAPVKMTEFSDFQCPYCRRYWQDTEQQVLKNYIQTGKVQFTYRSAGNWVSQNIGQGSTESQDAAMAAYCAGDQNKFFAYRDTLFNNVLGEDAGSFTPSNLKSFAKSIGLDTNQFNDCLNNKKYAGQVQQDYQDAIAGGIQGTPFFIITYTVNGQTTTAHIDGAQPYAIFQKALDTALGK
jgi:protein-disulfide isomerase